MVELLEPINVWVLFKNAQPRPYLFFWRNRPIKVTKINLVHTSKDGASLLYHFSLSSGDNFYKLRFDTKSLKWFLEAVDSDSIGMEDA